MNETTRTLEDLELVGGTLCLDFANTVNSRLNTEHDYLMQYTDLAGWARKVRLLSPTQARKLQKQAGQNKDQAVYALQTARTLRELVYAIFSKIAKGSEPKREDLEYLNQLYAEAISHSRLLKGQDHFAPTWDVDRELDAMLWPIIHSGGALLMSDDLAKVKECPGCGWLFLDTSKNQSRRWCSMNTCGARDKMRRYHKRKQAQ